MYLTCNKETMNYFPYTVSVLINHFINHMYLCTINKMTLSKN